MIYEQYTTNNNWFPKFQKELDAQLKTHIDPVTGCEVPYTPQGRFLHVPPPYPSASWANDFGTPWWKGTFIGLYSRAHKLFGHLRIFILTIMIYVKQIIFSKGCISKRLKDRKLKLFS